MDRIREWLTAIENSPPSIKKLLSSDKLSADAIDATIAHVLGKDLSASEKKIFMENVVPLLEDIDPTFTLRLLNGSHTPVDPFVALDARPLGYRFDLEKDIPWDSSMTKGRLFSSELLHSFGLDRQLQDQPELREELEWSWALTICRAFDFFEKDLIQKLGDRGNCILPTKSSQLLIEEEVKHRKLFKRLAKILEDLHPERLELFNSCYKNPVCYEMSFADRQDLEVIEQHQYIIWLYTVFFEDFTIYLHEKLQNSPDSIQETWRVAHECHGREEQQHLRTAESYLNLCSLDLTQMRSLSKEFFFALERNYLEFFGLGTCLRYIKNYQQDLGKSSVPIEALSTLPFFQDLLHHRLFEHTRTWAPVLGKLSQSSKPKENIPSPLRAEGAGHNLMKNYRENEVNLIHALIETSRKFPKHGIHIQNLSGEWRLISYQELYDNARDLSQRMSDSMGSSHFVLLYFPDIYHCLLGFWASLFAERVPVMLAHSTQIRENSEEARRLFGVLKSLESVVILTDLKSKKDLESLLESESVSIVSVEEALGREAKQRANNVFNADAPALLQFSSGSTGDPKGIVLTHRNILANALQMILARKGRHADRFLNWMPLHHDMGMIGFHITPLILGADQYHILPFQFMKHPALWPSLVSKHRITHAGTTNTALKTLLRWGKAKSRDSYDLSSLTSLIIGAEPIEKQTLDEITQVFAPLGLEKACLTPAFGMAEAALGVSFLEHQQTYTSLVFDRRSLIPGGQIKELSSNPIQGLALVNLGKAVMDLELKIVDEEGRTLPDGYVGFLCVKGPNVSSGYWSPRGFHRLLNFEGWYQSHDMGFLLFRCFYTVGRLQELFFNSGKNYYLNDVDSVVEQLAEVRPGGCATIVNPEGGQQASDLIAFVDLIHAPDQDIQILLEKVYRHINQRMGVSIGRIVALSRRHFLKTTSGKLKRWDMFRSWDSGNWKDCAVFEPGRKTRQRLETQNDDVFALAVAKIWSDILEQNVSPDQWDVSFSELGGTSLKAVRVHDALEQLVARPLDPSWLLSMNSIKQQADAIREAGFHIAGSPPPIPAEEKTFSPSPRVSASDPDSSNRIAIVGVGLRYPGARNLTEFSKIILEGKQNFKPLSDDRCRLIGLNPGQIPPEDRPYGSFLDDIDKFDARLFGLSPGLAENMDPQQRLLLEIAHVALSQSRISSNRLGVFVSSGDNEYEELIRDHRPLDEDALIGALANMVAAQISRAWHFHGPALKVDTACSSSLYAVHLACQALKLGECDAALAGGIQINLTTKGFDYFEAAGLLKQGAAPAPFSDQTSGLVPGEGGGLVVLKRYEDALRDQDFIYGVIRASGANNDGSSLSGTAPNPNGQIELLQDLYKKSGTRFRDLDYLEAHAAGTTIGDSIEVRALQTAFNHLEGKSTHRIALGSTKLFFGHCLSASGITSLLKVLAALRKSQMPASLLGHKPSARIDFAAGNFHPLEHNHRWNKGDTIRRAGINSLGLGGTNVHIIVEDAPHLLREPSSSTMPLIISVGGNSPDHYAQRFHQVKKHFLQTSPESQVSLTSATVLADQFASYRRLFWSPKAGLPPRMGNDALAGTLPKIQKNRPKIAFIYPGPGCQYPLMGQFLYHSVPSFRQALDDCHSRLQKLGFDLLSHMFDKSFETELMKIENSQPVVFSFSYALSRFLEELGVEPDLVIGHSAGEYAAAVQAGLMDLNSALHGILQRGRLMAASPLGGMAVVHLPGSQVQSYLHGFKNLIYMAALNSPQQTTVSGDPASLDCLIEQLEADGHQASRLDISCAAHSPAMQEAAIAIQEVFTEIHWKPGKTLFLSTVQDAPIYQLSAEYWGEQLVSPVYFSKAIERAIDHGIDIFLELSPTSGLSSCISAIDQIKNHSTKISLMRRGQETFDHTLESFSSLYSRGVPLRIEKLVDGPGPRDLLEPVFLRQSFWVKVEAKKEESPSQGNTYSLQTQDSRTMNDHLIQGRASAPFGLLMDILLSLQGSGAAGAFKDLVFLNSLYADSAKGVRFRQKDGQIELHSIGSGGAELFLAQALIDPLQMQVFHSIDVGLIRSRCEERVTQELIYERRRQSGLVIGPSLRAIKVVHKGDQELLVHLESSEEAVPGKWIQAALVDSAMQATSALFPAEEQTALYLGFGIELWQSFRPIQKECLVYIRLNKTESLDDIFKFDIIFTDLEGMILSQMHNFTVKQVNRPHIQEAFLTRPPEIEEPIRNSQAVDSVLFGILSKHLHRNIGTSERNELFSSLGVDSLKAVRIAGEIQKHFKIKLPATMLFECPNLKTLIQELERRIK